MFIPPDEITVIVLAVTKDKEADVVCVSPQEAPVAIQISRRDHDAFIAALTEICIDVSDLSLFIHHQTTSLAMFLLNLVYFSPALANDLTVHLLQFLFRKRFLVCGQRIVDILAEQEQTD